jgi:hypothetical protein
MFSKPIRFSEFIRQLPGRSETFMSALYSCKTVDLSPIVAGMIIAFRPK